MVSAVYLVLALVPIALCYPTSHIVGGDDVDIADFAWQGSLRTPVGDHLCGCVYVGGNYVLTAGHCGGDSSFNMEFGNSIRGTGPYTSIASVLRHPNYGIGPGLSPDNDIAIVTISGAINGNPTAGQVPPTADNPEVPGWITGWGKTCGECDSAVHLQGLEIPIISDELCAVMYERAFRSDSMICVWDEVNQDIGACQGDSGGPLAVGNVIYGLTSYGPVDCEPIKPIVYNRVGAHYSWICANSEGVNGCP